MEVEPKPVRILLIDPDEDIARQLVNHFTRKGIAFHWLQDADSAAECIADTSFDAAIVAATEASISGHTLVIDQWLKPEIDLPIVLAVHPDLARLAAKSIERGLWRYILRPYELAEADSVLKDLENAREYAEIRDYGIASEAVAMQGLLGADYKHTIDQKAFSIRNWTNTLRTFIDTHQASEEVSNEVKKILKYIDSVVDNIQATHLEAPETLEEGTLIDTELQACVKLWTRSYAQVKTVFDLNCPDIRVKMPIQWLYASMEKLVNNAAKAMDRKGQLTITTYREGDIVHIIIADTGHGIPEFARERFLRQVIHRPPARKKSGTGAGALVARFIARRWGGDLKLDYTETGKGTRLRMALPILLNTPGVED
jgi:signal transduction histidine kinase